MFIVAPRGCTKDATSGLTPIFFVHLSDTGKVAVELEALKPSVIAGRNPLKNFSGLDLAINFTAEPYTTKKWINSARSTIKKYIPRCWIAPNPAPVNACAT